VLNSVFQRQIIVNELMLLPEVNHTPLWQDHHQQKGHHVTSDPKDFYSGETLMLKVVGSPADIKAVTAWLDTSGIDGNRIFLETELSAGGQSNVFNGELYDTVLSSPEKGLPKGSEQVYFRIEYSNGVIKEASVPIRILGNVMKAVGVKRRH
jgi:hypothetical protein